MIGIFGKNACFDSIATGLGNHMSKQTIPDLVSIIANKLPIGITTVFVELSDTKLNIMSSIMNIGNLASTSFLNSTGRIVKTPISMDNTDRTADMMYVRISCSQDASLSDSPISQEP